MKILRRRARILRSVTQIFNCRMIRVALRNVLALILISVSDFVVRFEILGSLFQHFGGVGSPLIASVLCHLGLVGYCTPKVYRWQVDYGNLLALHVIILIVPMTCNICLDFAQDPVVTLCGHLYCWPCLYKWLHRHSYSQACPVCEALIQEETLLPSYGRGKKREDPRLKPNPGMEIPNRPFGHRPETAGPPNGNQYVPPRFEGTTRGRFTGNYVPALWTRFGNLGFSLRLVV
ncbi:hypothetical protein QQ045_025967 [Rhodiola kirilowii]